jgi:hypothetical protein
VEKIKDYIGTKLYAGLPDRERNATKWVEERKAKNIPIIPKITYLEAGFGAKGREQYRLAFAGNNISYVRGGAVPKDRHIYVMTAGMEFFGKPETSKTQVHFHHSSFLQGEKVGAAGGIEFEGSKPIIDVESGHYRPTLQHSVNALRGLEHKGAALDQFDARPIPEKRQKFSADAFLKLTNLVQKLTDTALEKLAKLSVKKRLKKLNAEGIVEEDGRVRYVLTILRNKLKNVSM